MKTLLSFEKLETLKQRQRVTTQKTEPQIKEIYYYNFYGGVSEAAIVTLTFK